MSRISNNKLFDMLCKLNDLEAEYQMIEEILTKSKANFLTENEREKLENQKPEYLKQIIDLRNEIENIKN